MSGGTLLKRRIDVGLPGSIPTFDEQANMSDFVFLFRSSEEGRRAAMGTPESAQRSLQAWMTWINDLEKNGHLKSRGQPLEASGKIVREQLVTDGPFVEAKDIVLGFMVIQAPDVAHAAEIAKGCPIAIGGGSVEVRPVMQLNF